MRDFELRRLSRDVLNPTFDKRHRYGLESVSGFPAGTVFTFFPAREIPLESGRTMRDPAAAHTPKHYAMGTLAEDMFAASEPTTPRNFAELVQGHGHSNPDGWALQVLEHLLASKSVGLEIIDSALTAVTAD